MMHMTNLITLQLRMQNLHACAKRMRLPVAADLQVQERSNAYIAPKLLQASALSQTWQRILGNVCGIRTSMLKRQCGMLAPTTVAARSSLT